MERVEHEAKITAAIDAASPWTCPRTEMPARWSERIWLTMSNPSTTEPPALLIINWIGCRPAPSIASVSARKSRPESSLIAVSR